MASNEPTIDLSGRVPEHSVADAATQTDSPASSKHPRLADYEILEQIGRGAKGIIYRARHLPLDRTVALKIVAPAQPTLMQRLRREAEAIAALSHPHIVQIYEVGAQDGQAYLALQLIRGGTLAQLIAGNPQP